MLNNETLAMRISEYQTMLKTAIEALEIANIGACAVGVPHPGERKVLRETVEHTRNTISTLTSFLNNNS